MVPIWGPDRIRLETIRVGFACFCAALVGYVQATRNDDEERNRLCPPDIYPDSLIQWARMFTRGTRAATMYNAEPDIAEWANGCALNPSRLDPTRRDDPDVLAAQAQLAEFVAPGLAQMAEFGREPYPTCSKGAD